MPHFAIVLADGETLGAVELARADWPIGSVIHRGDQPSLRVVDVIPPDDPEEFGILVVEGNLTGVSAASGGCLSGPTRARCCAAPCACLALRGRVTPPSPSPTNEPP